MKIPLLNRLAFNIDDQAQFIYLTPKRNLWFWLWVIYQIIKNKISEEQALND